MLSLLIYISCENISFSSQEPSFSKYRKRKKFVEKIYSLFFPMLRNFIFIFLLHHFVDKMRRVFPQASCIKYMYYSDRDEQSLKMKKAEDMRMWAIHKIYWQRQLFCALGASSLDISTKHSKIRSWVSSNASSLGYWIKFQVDEDEEDENLPSPFSLRKIHMNWTWNLIWFSTLHALMIPFNSDIGINWVYFS